MLQQEPIGIRAAEEVGDVKHLVTHNDPAVLVGVVLGNLLCADGHGQNMSKELMGEARRRRHSKGCEPNGSSKDWNRENFMQFAWFSMLMRMAFLDDSRKKWEVVNCQDLSRNACAYSDSREHFFDALKARPNMSIWTWLVIAASQPKTATARFGQGSETRVQMCTIARVWINAKMVDSMCSQNEATAYSMYLNQHPQIVRKGFSLSSQQSVQRHTIVLQFNSAMCSHYKHLQTFKMKLVAT